MSLSDKNYSELNPVKTSIPALNYHLFAPCNMRCKFCFATFQDEAGNHLPKGHLPLADSRKLIHEIANYGFKKINFAGGEPTLHPNLTELIALAKQLGLATSIVTNGTGLTEEFLWENTGQLDWIGISIDSVLESTNLLSGRALRGKSVLTLLDYSNLCTRVRTHGFRLKINTVVGSHNYEEDLRDFIECAQPERWKVFQALPVAGQNDKHIQNFSISKRQFDNYIKRHDNVPSLIIEDNGAMTNSYVMIDPSGKFYSNATGTNAYSEPILDIGIEAAYTCMKYDFERFNRRGGLYDWS